VLVGGRCNKIILFRILTSRSVIRTLVPFTKSEFSLFVSNSTYRNKWWCVNDKKREYLRDFKVKSGFIKKFRAGVLFKVYKIYILLPYVVASTSPQSSTVNDYDTS
jgi:hypothetical protein